MANKLPFSEVLSVSSCKKCLNDKQQSFETVLLVRHQNTSVMAMLGRNPFIVWTVYKLPEWLSQAQHFDVELDVDTSNLLVLSSFEKVICVLLS